MLLNLLDIGRRTILDHLHRAHVNAILGPGDRPVLIIIPDIGNHGIRMIHALARGNDFHLIIVIMAKRTVEPADILALDIENLIAGRHTVTAPVSEPPRTADTWRIVIHDVWRNLVIVHDMGMAGKDIHLAALQKSKHLVPVDNPPGFFRTPPSVDRTMLGHEDMSLLRNVLQEILDELEDLLRISLDILFLLVIDDVVHAEHQILAHPEGIIVRTEIVEIILRIIIERTLLVIVMVSGYGIDRETESADFLLVVGKKGREVLVPAGVTEHNGHYRTILAILLSFGLQILERKTCELLQLIVVPDLRVGNGKQSVA